MAGVEFELDPRGFAAAREYLASAAGFAAADFLADVAALLESSTRERFDAKAAPDGAAWPAWSRRYARRRSAHHSLLVSEGELRDSIAAASDAETARVGSNLVYAAVHQFGGEEAGMPELPARPYLGLSDRDEADILDLVEARLGEGGA